MSESSALDDHPEVELGFHDPRSADPEQRLIDPHGMTDAQLDGAVAVMDALYHWRKAEARVSAASQRAMALGENDLRAIRFSLVMSDRGQAPTPRAIAEHLGITTAAVAKLLHRLEDAGHIVRETHPSDGRSMLIRVSESTRAVAEATIGTEHARRFQVAAAMTPQEQRTVAAFLTELSRTREAEWGSPRHLDVDCATDTVPIERAPTHASH